MALPPLGDQRRLDAGRRPGREPARLLPPPGLALPEGELRDAAPKLLRYRLLHLPARLTRGQRKRWLHLRADWPWIDDLINAWRSVKAIPAPT